MEIQNMCLSVKPYLSTTKHYFLFRNLSAKKIYFILKKFMYAFFNLLT